MSVVDLGFRPRPWQDEVFRRLQRYSVLVVHRRGGKTILAIMRLIDEALRCPRSSGRYYYIAPYLKQAKAIAWDYLRRFAMQVPGAKENQGELWIEFPNGARIRIYGAEDPDSMRGLYADGVVVDEVAQTKPGTWGEVLLPMLSDRQGWALIIGTPSGVDLLSHLYHRGILDPSWYSGLYTYRDTGVLPESEIKILQESMSTQAFRREMMCDFSASADDVLLRIDDVRPCMGRVLTPDMFLWSQRRLGVDVARFGGDRTVIVRRQGLQLYEPIIMEGASTMEVAGRVAAEVGLWRPGAVFIDGVGVGGGVVDALNAHGIAAIDVQAGGRAGDPKMANVRTECWWRLAEWIKRGASIPRDDRFLAEMTSPTYWYQPSGKIHLEPKDRIKERLGLSPDLADAVALTFAWPDMPGEDRADDLAEAIRVKPPFQIWRDADAMHLKGRSAGDLIGEENRFTP